PIRVKAVGYRSKKEKNIAGVRQMVLEHVAKAEKEAGVEVKIEKLELGKADRLTEVFPTNGEIRSIKYARQKRKEGGSRKKEIERF
ncbi:MAG: hypothetical protein NT067_06985, partial [Candidatus Diapherotrites archaeon]|nr:hypothetical protein [Candidatus Diapherotrites archaeon]